jgi:glucokinase
MDLAIDIGGSKTLLAVFSPEGEVLVKYKMPTNKDYKQFLANVKAVLKNQLKDYKIAECCCSVPGLVDEQRGIGLTMGNLSWHNFPIVSDISRLIGGKPVAVENDAKLGGLSEALLVHNKYKKVVYLTISTGIGDGIIINGKIDQYLANSEAGHMVLPHEGKLMEWEDFASGKALVKRFGKPASELDDPAAWAVYSRDLALGLFQLISVIQPEVVIIGGGVGAHFDKFGQALKNELKKLENDMVKVPPVMGARRPEEAVIYGCYEYIKQKH